MDLLTGMVGPGAAALPGDGANGAGPGFAFRASAADGRLLHWREGADWLACVGSPLLDGAPAQAADLARRLRAAPAATLAAMGGRFALAHHDGGSRTLRLATDLFGSLPLAWAEGADGLAFGTDFAWVTRQGGRARALDPQALYDYLFFSVVPSSRSIVAGLRKLARGSVLEYRDGRARASRYWEPDFSRAGPPASDLARETFDAIAAAVAGVANLPDAGCFLSGGLDSSTVSGLAARSRDGATTHAFTIGFDVEEFDESAYARITARHFGLELHEHRILSGDISRCVDRVIAAFPEPFGNPSAIPAYLCADFAREAGVANMLAGDGGDEIFAGNERYQKQSLFNVYGELPALVRRGLVDPLAVLVARAPGPLPKLASYVRQARVPLPDRLFSYNLLVRNDPSAVLTGEFLRTVDTESPYEYARGLYGEPQPGDALDRMLFLDWTTTLTDNDLPKVTVGCGLAGVAVHFPLLDPRVVEVSTRIPSADKLTLRELRKFYKEAFTGFLPEAVLTKTKHGFGVPVGIWVNRDAALRERVCSRLDALGHRGIIRREIITQLLELQSADHASYYGALLWPLFALEEWLQANGL